MLTNPEQQKRIVLVKPGKNGSHFRDSRLGHHCLDPPREACGGPDSGIPGNTDCILDCKICRKKSLCIQYINQL